jgi:hypothetical protein
MEFSREHKFIIGQTPSVIDDVMLKPDIWVLLLYNPDTRLLLIPSMLLVTTSRVESGPAPTIFTWDLMGTMGLN